MPTYEYKCRANGHLFEELQSFTAEPVAVCPTCGSEAARQISIPTVIYKGSGFYTTDYGGNKRNGASSESDSGTSGSSESPDTSSDSASPSSKKSSSTGSSKNKSSRSGD